MFAKAAFVALHLQEACGQLVILTDTVLGNDLEDLPTSRDHKEKPWEWGPAIQQMSRMSKALSQDPTTSATTAIRASFLPAMTNALGRGNVL